jgi:hypothetical protein
VDPLIGFPFPTGVSGVYRDTLPHIVAQNHDELGWYCWTPNNPEPNLVPWGTYLVPTWDFGSIPVGASVQRVLKFSVDGGGLPPGDPRYNVIVTSATQLQDLLLNRTTSLKISTWIEDIALDNNVPYPEEAGRSSDCSVFHAIEPKPLVVSASLDWSWVYRNHPVTTAWKHKCVLTVNVAYDPNANLTYTVNVTKNAASVGHVIIQATANPLIWDILGGNGALVPPDPFGAVTLDVQVTGNEFGGTGSTQANLTVQKLTDITGEGIIGLQDKVQLNKRLNGLPTPGYVLRHFDFDVDGLCGLKDKVIMNKFLNGLPVP